MTNSYPDSIKVESPEKVALIIDTEAGLIKFNESEIHLGTLLDSVFVITGTPERYKTMLNSSTYIFDKFGFYLHSDEEKRLYRMSVYYKIGKLDISPKSIYQNKISIDGIEISEKSLAEDIIQKLALEKHPLANDNYVKETAKIRLVLNFDSPNKELVNLLVEKK